MNTESDHAAAQKAAALCLAWQTLKTEQHLSGNQAAVVLGKAPSWFSLNAPRFQREGLAAFLLERRALGAARKLFTDLPAWFLPVARFFYLTSNLTCTRGSVPEAIRCALSLPLCPNAIQSRLLKIISDTGWQPVNGETLPSCPPDLRQAILARAKAGKPMLPESITRQIPVAAPFVRSYRNPKNAALDFVSAGGTQMWLTDPQTGQKQFIQSGDVVEADDATINFPVCVPWEIRGCPCSERYGVKVGRFQWLVAIDVGSRKILGFTWTARPHSSYRGEDVLALMRCVASQHGIPRHWRLEKGVWASHLVQNAIRLMGAGHLTVHSPHCKPFIEGLFNALWTRLSVHFPDASVGRFQGEHAQACKLLTACQAGQQDPRRHFPMMAEVLAAMQRVIAEYNAHEIDSANYGRWIPNERWEADMAARPLPPLNPESAWLFAPFAREWRVKGATVGGKVPLFPGCSVPYQFTAAKLLEFHGAIVRCHFDPAEPRCIATVCLAQPWANRREGEVLCSATQINETTRYVRSVMGWGSEGPDEGMAQRRATETALRRESRAIAGPRCPLPPVSESEERNGAGGLGRITRGLESAPAAAPDAPAPAPIDPIVFTTRTGKIARLPLAIRDEVNRRLREGESQKRMVAWLNDLDAVRQVLAVEFNGKAITEQNLSQWKHGGFQDALRYNSVNNSGISCEVSRQVSCG